MNIFNRLAYRLIERAKRTPYFDIPGYMERYWIVPYGYEGSWSEHGCGRVSWKRPIARLLQKFGVAARVHHILRSDDARSFHDHPWPYLTVVLVGGYTEVKPYFDDSGIYIGDVRHWHGPGSVLYRPAKSWHRLEIPAGSTAWTLFITGKKQQRWGFLPEPAYKVDYRKYLGVE